MTVFGYTMDEIRSILDDREAKVINLKVRLSESDSSAYQDALMSADANTLAIARFLQQISYVDISPEELRGEFRPAPVFLFQADALKNKNGEALSYLKGLLPHVSS